MKSVFLSLLILSFAIMMVSSCNNDLPNSCSSLVQDLKIDYSSCGISYVLGPLLPIYSQLPQFMSGDDDLEKYFTSRLDICGLDKIVDGKITIVLFIKEDGTPCLSRAILNNVFKRSANGFSEIIEEMPKWKPGVLQSGEKTATRISLYFYFKDGQFVKFERN